MAQVTTISITRGEENVIVATTDAGVLKHLAHLGFEPQEEDEDGIKYLELPKVFVQLRRPKQVREKTAEEKAAIRARLVAGKANKAGKPVGKAAAAATKNGKTSLASKAKASAKAAPEPEPEPEPEPAPTAKKSGLASRVKITR